MNGIEHFRQYLLGAEFVVETDHRPLITLMTQKEATGRVARWRLYLQEYNFTIRYKKGKENVVADLLSRDVAVVKNAHQRGDDIYDNRDLKTFLRKREMPTSLKTKTANKIKRLAEGMELKDGVLYHYGREIPKKEARSDIVTRMHQMGHYGIQSTCDRIQQRYWWPKMADDIRNCIQNCANCNRFADDRGPTKMKAVKGNIRANRVWQKIGIDFMGPLRVTDRGNRFILVVTDYLTKWAEAIPTPDKSALTVARCLFEHVICRYGSPEEIISDQGTEFVNSIVSTLLMLEGTVHATTSGYHHQTNGQTEKRNHTLAESLRKIISKWSDKGVGFMDPICSNVLQI